MCNETKELPSALELALAVRAGKWPHTMDAQEWTREWRKTLTEHPNIANDDAAMVGWFANAIMAGYDAAMLRHNAK